MALNDGLQLELLMNDASGTNAADSSGQGRTCALTNTPTWTSGKINGGLNFASASAEYGSVTGYAGITGGAARTIEWWFKSGTTGSTSNFMWSFGTSSAAARFAASLETSGIVWMRGSSGPTGQFGTGLANSAWHQGVMTHPDNGTMSQVECWIDGVKQTGTFANGSTTLSTGSGTVRIASDVSAGANVFNGDLDIFRIWNRKLSDAEIALLWNGGAGRESLVESPQYPYAICA